MAILDDVRGALRLTVHDYDPELVTLIAAGAADLRIAGIPVENASIDPLIERAIITYCRAFFGSPDDYDRIKAAYDEQKAQLQSASGYGLRYRHDPC